jgi:hypothetical protein
MGIKHLKVSAKPDGSDSSLVNASDWNATHTIDPGTIGTAELGGDITAAGKALLDDASASVQRTTLGLATVASSASASDLTTGTLAAARMPALTGDVTSSVGTVATTIAAGAVTLAKMAALATSRFLGRITGGSGDPEALTGTQATTLLDIFTTTLKGLVPSSGGANGNFLKDDGTWSVPVVSAQDYLGDGSDGSPTFDGAATILGLVPSGNVYTLTRDLFLDSPTINNGVTIKLAGYSFICKGTCTLNGVIERNGNNAVNSSSGLVGAQGAALTGGRLPGSGAGGAGVNANINGNAAGNISGTPQGYTNSGGTGGSGTGGSGGLGGTSTEAAAGGGGWRVASQAMKGRNWTETLFSIGPGGGGGAGNSGSPSGSGGGGGGWGVAGAKQFTGSGSMQAKGGNGGNAFNGGGNSGGGGGGVGGVFVVVYVTGTAPTVSVTGGSPGTGVGTGTNGNSGGAGISLILRLGA